MLKKIMDHAKAIHTSHPGHYEGSYKDKNSSGTNLPKDSSTNTHHKLRNIPYFCWITLKCHKNGMDHSEVIHTILPDHCNGSHNSVLEKWPENQFTKKFID